MAVAVKRRRLANPTRKRSGAKRLTLKQKLHFGTKRQRAAAKASLSRKRKPTTKRKRATTKLATRTRHRAAPKARKRVRRSPNRAPRRTSNIGEIVTIGLNPGTPKRRSNKTMAKRRKTRRRRNTTTTRRRRNYAYASHRRKANPTRRRRTYTRRRRATGRRRRNPGQIGSMVQSAFAVIGGASATQIIMGLLPPGLRNGFMGYFSTAGVAIGQGMVGKRVFGAKIGNEMTLGGVAVLAIRLVNDFLPQIPLPISLSGGVGRLAPSSFYVPQVPISNSLTQFRLPPAVRRAIPAPAVNGGIGAIGMGRRMGRMR